MSNAKSLNLSKAERAERLRLALERYDRKWTPDDLTPEIAGAIIRDLAVYQAHEWKRQAGERVGSGKKSHDFRTHAGAIEALVGVCDSLGIGHLITSRDMERYPGRSKPSV